MKHKFPVDYFVQKSFTYFMALRVLLADESPTIKKVFQLSLQDYGVEVKSVNVGGDVIEVANHFKPDIIFADVLLQQMSGYQVSSELKVDPELKEIPVVLMWSGFLEIDEDKFQASHANAKLEKPFEVENLRSIIQNLVPKVKSQNLSEYLDFPDLPEFDENKNLKKDKKADTKNAAPTAPQKPQDAIFTPPPVQSRPLETPAAPPTPPPLKAEVVPAPQKMEPAAAIKNVIEQTDQAESDSYWNMENFEAVNITQQMPSRKPDDHSLDQELIADKDEDSEWVQGSIENFKLNVHIDDNTNVEEVEVPLERIIPESAVEAATRASSLLPPLPKKNYEEVSNDDFDLEIETPPETKTGSFDLTDFPQLTEERLTDLIRAQSKEIIEKVVWQVVPELATQIIERELKRLLAEQSENNVR